MRRCQSQGSNRKRRWHSCVRQLLLGSWDKLKLNTVFCLFISSPSLRLSPKVALLSDEAPTQPHSQVYSCLNPILSNLVWNPIRATHTISLRFGGSSKL